MPARPEVLPIIVDNPTNTPGLGFNRYVQGIAAAALGGSPARYTIGLYGPWGSGKSSLLGAIEERISEISLEEASRPLIVRFDAWRYEKSELLIFPLLHAVNSEIGLQQSRLGAAGDKITKSIKGLLGSLELSFLGVGLKYDKSTAADNASYSTPFTGLSDVSSAIGNKRRIIVLVDDLDRCSPDGVVNVLEAIHVLTDVNGFVFILALDYDYLTSAISEKYEGIDPDRFIEKIVQVPFHIPRPELGKEALNEIVPNWKKTLKTPWFDGVQEELLQEIIYLALRSNPRQVKRLINTFLLARFMDWDSDNRSELVLKVLGLQLAWPSEFRRLHDASASVLKSWEESDEPLQSDEPLLGGVFLYASLLAPEAEDGVEEQSALSIYLEKVLTKETQLTELLPILSLTENVTETERAGQKGQSENRLTAFELTVQRAPSELGHLLDSFVEFVTGLGEDVTKQSRQNFISFGRESSGSHRPKDFVSFNLKPTKNRLLIYLSLDPRDHVREGVTRDVTSVGHHGNGSLEIALHPGEVDNVEWAKGLIQRNYDLKGL